MLIRNCYRYRTVVTCKLKSNSNETAKLLPAHARFHGLSPSPLKPRTTAGRYTGDHTVAFRERSVIARFDPASRDVARPTATRSRRRPKPVVGPAAGALERRRPAAPDEFAARRADRVTRQERSSGDTASGRIADRDTILDYLRSRTLPYVTRRVASGVDHHAPSYRCVNPRMRIAQACAQDQESEVASLRFHPP